MQKIPAPRGTCSNLTAGRITLLKETASDALLKAFTVQFAETHCLTLPAARNTTVTP